MKKIINKWHDKLGMPKRDLDWHINDINDEYQEYLEARGFIDIWSELSDVAYTYTRAVWSGHKDVKFPFGKTRFIIGLLYMFPKYSLRWKFYNKLGKKFDENLHITEVRNPVKIEKLDHVAKKYNLDPIKFKSEAQKLMKYWVFLK
jgi:hypothetical protein